MGPPHLLHPQASLAAPRGVELCRGPGAQGFPTLSLAVRKGASPGSSSHGPTCPSYGSVPPDPPGSPKDGDPPGRQPPPLASLWAPGGNLCPGEGGQQRRGHEASLGLRTDRRSGIKQRPGTPSGHPGSGGHGGRGEAKRCKDRWAGNPRPRRGQPPAWARGPRRHLWKRGCSTSLTEKPARPEPLVVVREGGSSAKTHQPHLRPPSWVGPALQAGELRETQKPPNATLPPAAGDRARGTGPGGQGPRP